MADLVDMIRQVVDLGGPVILLLIAASVLVLAVALYKVVQFQIRGVGRHRALREAITAWDAGGKADARTALSRSSSYLAPVVEMAFRADPSENNRLVAEAEQRFSKLERGLGSIENVAQLAPLLGLFGTVLGMIEAFQALQNAGSQVDPSILAGGIWVALMTTAAGLAVAMPAALIHAWLTARMDAERGIADHAIQTVLHPQGLRAQATAAVGAGQPTLA